MAQSLDNLGRGMLDACCIIIVAVCCVWSVYHRVMNVSFVSSKQATVAMAAVREMRPDLSIEFLKTLETMSKLLCNFWTQKVVPKTLL